MTAIAPEDVPIPADPTVPFGVDALPQAAVAVTDAQIERAYHTFLDRYGTTGDRQGALIERITRAYTLLRDRSRWTITAAAVELTGSGGATYRVTPGLCEGPAWFHTRRRQHTTTCRGANAAADGVCYHMYAAEMLRLAQALAALEAPGPAAPATLAPPPQPDAPPSCVAHVTITGRTLLAICGYIHLACPDLPDVTVLLGDDSLALECGAHFAAAPAAPSALAVCTLRPEEFRDLWSAVRPNAREIPLVTLRVLRHAASDHGLLALVGGALDLAVAMKLSC